MSNDTQPEIRFPGFTEDWEQRKFKEIINERREKTKVENEDILLSSAIKGMFLNSELFSHFRGSSNIGYLKIKKNDLILSAQNLHLGNCNVNLRFDSGIVSPAYKVYELVNAEPNYINSWLKRDTTKNFFLKATTEGASVCRKNIEWETLYSQKLYIPKIEEQIKIGNFFKQLDETIALHQRKLDLLKETKKGFLQKMFPKNGAKVPEIRFPGFTEDWEQRRLQEVVDRYDNLRIPITASKRVAGNTPYYGANGIQGYVEGYTHDGEFILVAEDGANDLKNYPVQYVDGKVWVNNHAHVIQAKENLADNMFLMNAIRSINIEPFLVGGGRAKLNADVLMKLEVIIPLKSEQQKIGNFFKQLDDTITLHQRKLDLLKETKKGFLQKMFV